MSGLCIPDEIQAIRSELYLARAVTPATLQRIENLLRTFPESPQLWILRGDAIRLGTDVASSRSDAEASYRHALALDPSNREALEALERLRELS